MRSILVLLIIIPLGLFAQDEAKKPSIVYYDDGSVYVGHIIENKASEIKLVNMYGDTLVLSTAYIKRIRFGGDIRLAKNRKFHFTQGEYADVSYGFSANENSNGLFVTMGVGHRIKNNLNIGFGTGIVGETRSFRLTGAGSQWVWIDNAFIPIFATGQYYLSDWNNRPYVKQDLGYSIGLNNQWNTVERLRGGLYSKTSIGFHFASRKKMKFFAEFFQYLHQSSGSGIAFSDFGDPVQYEFDVWSRRIGFAIGITLF
ncbi:MAG: hypothetical protein AAF487_04720 [Bacteroidota bacterium]